MLVLYLDLTGSGNETISAHLYEPRNGRLVIMFKSFRGLPAYSGPGTNGKVFERVSPESERLSSEGDSEHGFPTPEINCFLAHKQSPGSTFPELERPVATPSRSWKFEAHRDTLYKDIGRKATNKRRIHSLLVWQKA
ncbi:hypothetical protein BC835DRAFT_1414084 [Cytidiella melzeri]|nr:hypothetical protein BC835DRAFT_1414084 [Cytidiella melzeri]